jgi:hypothetical protein
MGNITDISEIRVPNPKIEDGSTASVEDIITA